MRASIVPSVIALGVGACGGDAAGGEPAPNDGIDAFIASLGLVCAGVRACYPEHQIEPLQCRAPGDGESYVVWSDPGALPESELARLEDCLRAHVDRPELADWLECWAAAEQSEAECLSTCPASAEACVIDGNAAAEACRAARPESDQVLQACFDPAAN